MAGWASSSPVTPPETKNETKPRAYIMEAVQRICPPQRVASQLKTLIAEGTPTVSVSTEKTMPASGLMPLANMWWPHTMKPMKPMEKVAITMARYAKIGFRENVEMMCDVIPMPGRMMM